MKKVAVSIHAIDNFDPKIIDHLKGLDFIHIDVADGKFTDVRYDNLEVFKILTDYYDIPILAHLMVMDPISYVDKIIDYIDTFTFHYEIEQNRKQIMEKVKVKKKKVGIALNPDTEISLIVPLLKDVDMILIMSVYPGRSGQKFLDKSIGRVNLLNDYKTEICNFLIEIDGGINLENAKKLNVDILSSTSTILNANDPNQIIKLLKK
ncbi:MAG: hypothetical protein ACFFKA_05285 [Candidatus Thorarchaeota archaeon]